MVLTKAKISIVAVNTLTFHYILKASGNLEMDAENQISNPFLLYTVLGIATWLAASIFLAVIDNVVTTLIVCLSLDLQKYDPDDTHGSGKFGPPTFHDKRLRMLERAKQRK